jgi:hypothetical protein
MLSLDELSKKYYLDKNLASGCHDYIPGYSMVFDGIRTQVKTVLEIGIGSVENGQMCSSTGEPFSQGYRSGNGLRCWQEYFPNAKIYGIDLYEHKELNYDRIKTFVADQYDTEQMNYVIQEINELLDIIIDDGSHFGEHQMFSFMLLSQYLSPNGIYVIEDIHPDNIESFKDLSIFPEHFRNYIYKNFHISLFDTRISSGRIDDYMIVFKLKK